MLNLFLLLRGQVHRLTPNIYYRTFAIYYVFMVGVNVCAILESYFA